MNNKLKNYEATESQALSIGKSLLNQKTENGFSNWTLCNMNKADCLEFIEEFLEPEGMSYFKPTCYINEFGNLNMILVHQIKK
jgi:hypothetical protein